MADFVEKSSQGWLSRIMESIKGVLFGLVLVAAAFPLLWVNEGCAVKIAKGLAQGRGSVVMVAHTPVVASNHGKLVHLQGKATTTAGANDTLMAVKAPGAIKLTRSVEMYQWVEHTTTKKEKKVGGAEETTTEYSYTKEWSSAANNSKVFKVHVKDGQSTDNPAMAYQGESFAATDVTVGAFSLTPGLVSDISGDTPHYITVVPPGLTGARVEAGGLYISSRFGSASSPQVGDYRIKWSKTEPGDVTIIARQNGNSLDDWPTSQGTTIGMLQKGNATPDQMFTSAEKGNATRTWFCRLGGFLMMMIGLTMIFKPLSTVADVVPLIGGLVGMGTSFVSFVLAAPLSLLTIALAWVFYRPLIGIPLLLLAVGVLVGGFMLARKRKTA